MRGSIVGGDGLEAVEIELVEVDKQLRQIAVQILINLLDVMIFAVFQPFLA